MWNSKIWIIIFSLLPFLGNAQDCELSLAGTVMDAGTGQPLFLVSIYVEETGAGTLTDSLGAFRLAPLCAGDYHLVFSHIGCEPKRVFIALSPETPPLQVQMEHSVKLLEDVVVMESLAPKTTQRLANIDQVQITESANENLSGLLTELAGVSSLRNGSQIAKPVVHGLYGNRLVILNNGIAQAGQQWGNDHSPEIDPLTANRIRVIKGAGALEYPGATFGAVVLVEPSAIAQEPHLHGSATYFFESNGRSQGLNIQMQQYRKTLAWRLNGTLKASGDRQTPDYYLNNTGSREANLALQLERNFRDRLFFSFFASTFNTELGILRGSHIGNLTDLESAFQQEEPFYTEPSFSYAIDPPKQRVQHHLVKGQLKYYLNDRTHLDLTLAGQMNDRKEFDVRRSGRSDIPALSLRQYTGFMEGKYVRDFSGSGLFKAGLQLTITDNTNNPETGILPLIPDYLSVETGGFLVVRKEWGASLFETGLRYDLIVRDVAAISQSLPRRVIRFNDEFHNLSGLIGWQYRPADFLRLSVNMGYGLRNPAVNELYSNGLHQGVSGIEEGNPDLQTERSLKGVFGLNGQLGQFLSLEGLAYYQQIENYIYLEPQNELRLTIRGAFPVFQYTSTDARIYGMDLTIRWDLSPQVQLESSGSFIRGEDLSNEVPLINMPSNDAGIGITWAIARTVHLGRFQLSNTEIHLRNRYVFRQNHLLPEQDFVLPPEGYNLLNIGLATDLQLGKFRLRLFSRVENVLNTRYRDYLNRQRYFSDDLGINGIIGINWKW